MIRPEYSEEQLQNLKDYVQSLPPAQCSYTVCTPSPGTPDYESMRSKIWVENPHDLHDCTHPLTPTKIPLRRSAALFAELASAGTARTPMRINRHLAPPQDLVRIVRAERNYHKGFREMYREFPEELWN